MIQIKSLNKIIHGQKILSDVSFKVRKGEIAVLTGPSGGGKSTLLRCMAQLDTPTSGEMKIGSNTGMVFQSYNLFPHMTVLKNLTYAPVRTGRLSQEQAIEKALALLEKGELKHRAYAYPKTLSGGEKQRLAILRALMMDPDVALFDEPTSALDPERTASISKLLRDLAQAGITLLIVSHDAGFISSVADRVLTLEQGRLSEVVAEAQHTHVDFSEEDTRSLTQQLLRECVHAS